MRDEDFEIFIEEFGEATMRSEVPTQALEVWQDKLPTQFLDYWRTEGLCGYSNGLIWTVNPTDYEDIVDEWLKGTRLVTIDRFHVLIRTAFGKLYLWGEKTGDCVTIVPSEQAIFCLAKDLRRTIKDPTYEAQCFFSNRNKRGADLKDDAGKPLFEQALKELGPLNSDEMYGFSHALVLGGKASVQNLERVEIRSHLGLLRQIAPPTFPMGEIDLDKLP